MNIAICFVVFGIELLIVYGIRFAVQHLDASPIINIHQTHVEPMYLFLIQKVRMKGHKNALGMQRHHGFTVVELLVVMSILLTVSSIVLMRHNEFRANILLRSIAYEIALTIRQAQVYGLGIKEFQGIADPIAAFEIGYGVHFDEATPTMFILFADLDDDRRYVAANDTIVQLFTLPGGNVVVDVCAGAGVNVGCIGRTILDIVYERPEPDAYISASQGTATIRIRSPYGKERIVSATITGQILVP